MIFFVISIKAIFQEAPGIRQPVMLSFVPTCSTKYEICPYYLKKDNRWIKYKDHTGGWTRRKRKKKKGWTRKKRKKDEKQEGSKVHSD